MASKSAKNPYWKRSELLRLIVTKKRGPGKVARYPDNDSNLVLPEISSILVSSIEQVSISLDPCNSHNATEYRLCVLSSGLSS